eukprot:2115528-Pyramimonas_sp.AAC.1
MNTNMRHLRSLVHSFVRYFQRVCHEYLHFPGDMPPPLTRLAPARQVVAAGTWEELVLYGGGKRIDDNCHRLPFTAALLDLSEAASCATGLALAKGGEIL